MRLNSPAALAAGRRLFTEYGGWDALREACDVAPDGTYHLVRRPDGTPLDTPKEPQ